MRHGNTGNAIGLCLSHSGGIDESRNFAFVEEHNTAVDFMTMDESGIGPAENRFRVNAKPGGKRPCFAEFADAYSIMDASRCS